MTKEVQKREAAEITGYSADKIELIKKTVAKGATDEELQLFLYQAKKTGLDPLLRQIHFVKFGERMSIQTGIDGLRLIADRTGKYAPGERPEYFATEDGKLDNCYVYVKKLVAGEWHKVGAIAYFNEYAQRFNTGELFPMWRKMPKNQLAKCAEAKALRMAFPAEMSDLYVHEEVSDDDIKTVAASAEAEVRAEAAENFVKDESRNQDLQVAIQEHAANMGLSDMVELANWQLMVKAKKKMETDNLIFLYIKELAESGAIWDQKIHNFVIIGG